MMILIATGFAYKGLRRRPAVEPDRACLDRSPRARPDPQAVGGARTSGFRSPGRGRNMKNVANSRFTIKNWDENPYSEGQDLPKLTRAAVTKTFTGLERVVGRVAGKAGSFVLQRTGVFENGAAKESYVVIPGSGTGELRGLRGEGTSAVGHGTEHPLTLNYELG